jgi:hypothetical protein
MVHSGNSDLSKVLCEAPFNDPCTMSFVYDYKSSYDGVGGGGAPLKSCWRFWPLPQNFAMKLQLLILLSPWFADANQFTALGQSSTFGENKCETIDDCGRCIAEGGCVWCSNHVSLIIDIVTVLTSVIFADIRRKRLHRAKGLTLQHFAKSLETKGHFRPGISGSSQKL